MPQFNPCKPKLFSMKKILFSTAIMLIFNLSNAQLWFDVGLKAGGGTGFLKNKNISTDNRLSVNPGYGYFYGGKIGINYGYFVSIATDITFGKNSFSFMQNGIYDSTRTYKYNVTYNSLNIVPLFRYTKEASYLELGPEFSLVKKPTYSDEATNLSNVDASNYVSSKLTGLVFGFGGYIVGNDVIALQMGFRAHYSFTNLTSDESPIGIFPLTNYTDLSASPTNPISIQLHMELNVSLGQIARSSSKCGRRVAFLSF